MFRKVREFNETFGIDLNDKATLIKDNEWQLRYDLQAEELDEYFEACVNKDKVEILDSLVDQMYILIGTIQKHGMESIFEKAFDEVHRSNMSKLGSDGKPIYREDGKVMKGPDYFKPNLSAFFNDE